MNVQPSASSKSVEKEFFQLLDAWEENHETSGYDPIPFLTRCADIFEDQTVEFHKGDPDPFDDRHPEYIKPGCTFAKLLVILSKNDDLIDKLISTYLRVKTDPSDPSPITVATARLLLAVKPGLEVNNIYKENEWVVDCLTKWVKEAHEPLRTYGTGLLAGALEPQKTENDEYIRLISLLLKRLWNHVVPGKFPEVEILESKNGSNELNSCEPYNITTETNASRNVSLQAVSKDSELASKKRKMSDESAASLSKKLMVDSRVNYSCQSAETGSKISNEPTLRMTGTSKKKVGLSSVPPSILPMSDFYDNDLSNSSWSEQMPVVVGCSYSLKTPLSSNICQRFILEFLKSLGEYQDLLSVFLELKALDLINIYLTEKKSDGLLTFKALEFLASLLCHNKVATEFVEMKGTQNLLSVQRPSMGSTGVSFCLYYLAYKKEAMERVCQLPHRVLTELVKYAIWLLECSHESGRTHAALFFSISFSFRIILGLFDQMNGLRCLLNMISTSSPILNPMNDDENSESSDELHFTRQMARTVCFTLKKYFEAHLVMKVCNIQKSFRVEERPFPLEMVPKHKAMVCTREQLFEYLEFLVGIQEKESSVSSTHLSQWHPVQNFMRLDGMALILKVIALACDWSSFVGRVETVRSALDVIAVLTVTPKAQLALCDQYVEGPLNSKLSGMSVILGVAEGEHYLGPEGEAQKSALAVILNCVCGSPNTYAGSVGVFMKGTPQRRASSRSHDEIREKLWKCVQNNNGIKVLLSLLVINHPAQLADDIRYFACKALHGLSNYKPVTQIMSKLPFFINGQIQLLTREPVMYDKKRLHVKLCNYLEALIERVSGRPSTVDLDLETIRKSHIVSETYMRFSNKQVLQLIHSHLVWSGLHKSAEALVKESGLVVTDAITPPTSGTFVFPSPQTSDHMLLLSSSGPESSMEVGAGGDAQSSLSHKRISFTRGSHAVAETPTPSSVINIITPVNQKKRFHSRSERDNILVSMTPGGQSRFKLSSSGIVTVKPKSFISDTQEPPSPTTLNSIIEERFKRQHARCRNPVVTVPEFSLFTPHCCPEPRYRVEAPINVTKRMCHRQGICPAWGGIGGASCDRQLIYSRFKPGAVFKGTEDNKVPFTCVAFMPGCEELMLGDYQGDITMYDMYNDNDRVINGVAGTPITYLEPSKSGECVLVTSEGVWSTVCSLYSTGTTFEQKATYEGVNYVEFAKLHQDKVIGTKDHKAMIFDANTGQVLDVFEREDMASHYTYNRATFSPNDELVLSDGLLWDIRRPHLQPIHKFDKFNTNLSGVFHPQGLEVIINTEIWDLRNFHLLHTVPALDQCCLVFNQGGSIVYAVRKKLLEDDDMGEDIRSVNHSSAFRTFDGFDYKQLAFVPVRHQIYDLAVDSMDYNIAVVETLVEESWEEPRMSVCKLYEVGQTRGDDDEGDEDESIIDDENNSSDRSSTSSRDDGDGSSRADADDEFDLDDEPDMIWDSDHDQSLSISDEDNNGNDDDSQNPVIDDHDRPNYEEDWETIDDSDEELVLSSDEDD